MSELLSCESALEKIHSVAARKLRQERKVRLPIERAVGRVSAEDIRVSEAHPRFDNSAMDGFVVRSEWTLAANASTPVDLEIKGVLGAGDHLAQVGPTACTYEIMTGAEMPAGFDTILRQEDAEVVERDGKKFLRLRQSLRPWNDVRRAGEDLRPGETILSRGDVLRPGHVMALVSQGVTSVEVRELLRVGLICTGSELVDASETPGPAQIRNSNAPYLAAKSLGPNVELSFLGNVRDSREALTELIAASMDRFDILVTTGAVSVGRFDLVPPVVEALGAQIHFHKVALRPGKPLLFADFETGPLLLGFPGNPIAGAVAYRFFLEPLLRTLLGAAAEKPLRLGLTSDVKKPEALRCFWRARLESEPDTGPTVRALVGQESFRIRTLVEATHWAVLPEGTALCRAGDVVEVWPLDSNF